MLNDRLLDGALRIVEVLTWAVVFVVIARGRAHPLTLSVLAIGFALYVVSLTAWLYRKDKPRPKPWVRYLKFIQLFLLTGVIATFAWQSVQ